jgi:hypothetical protein
LVQSRAMCPFSPHRRHRASGHSAAL